MILDEYDIDDSDMSVDHLINLLILRRKDIKAIQVAYLLKDESMTDLDFDICLMDAGDDESVEILHDTLIAIGDDDD